MKYNKYELTKEQIEEAILNTQSMAAAAKYLGVSRNKFRAYADKYSLFSPNQAGKGIWKGVSYKNKEDVFTEGKLPRSVLIKWLKRTREWKCECCGLSEWNGKELTLEIHHIDGNPNNNVINNLQILCPNCHSQTDNWRSKNIKGYNKTFPKVSDEELLNAIKDSNSLNEALKYLGLSGAGNFIRANRLLLKEYKKIAISNDNTNR
jgi:hypothetical protein